MKRRDLLRMLGGAGAFTLKAQAQSRAVPMVGYLGSESPEAAASRLNAFHAGLADFGYSEGHNVTVEYRWAQGRYDRLPSLAAELVDRRVRVLAAPGGAEVALAAKAATTTIPIVFEMGGDPVAVGVVDRLSRPGGNLTGVSSLSVEVSRKRLELLHEVLPGARVFAVVLNPRSPTAQSQLKNLQAAAVSLDVQLDINYASTEQEIEGLFKAWSPERTGGLVFSSDPFFAYRSSHVGRHAVHYAVPAITQSRDFPLAGGLMSYGGDFGQSHRQAGVYVGRILKGEVPSDLPVQQVTKVELFVNLKAASALGVTLSLSLLSSADVVIK